MCEWDGDKLTAWVSTQAVHGTREGFAEALGIPQANVRVICEYMGGGFGSKFGPDVQGVLCAKLAKEAKAPVKLMLDRKEEHLAGGNRPSAYAKIRAGAAADGTLTFFDAESWGTGGAGAGSGFPLPYIYVFPNRRRVHKDVYINAGQQRAMRAPGHPQGCFITEVLMDELADKAGMDPVEFRIRNLPKDAPDAKWREYYKLAAERFGWSKRHATGDPTPGHIKRGFGCAANRWGGGGRGTKAYCEIHPDGGVVMRSGTQDLGVGTKTLVAVITAETLGLPVSAVKAEIGDSNYPFSGGSGGSTTAPSVSPAIRVTASLALEALAARVAPTLGVPADQITAADGKVFAKNDPSKSLTWKEACKLLGTEPVSVNGEWQPGLSASGTSGVQMAEVEVDIETGITHVKRITCVQDCGLVVNRMTAESQINGGIIGGIGYALFEDRILDRNTGQMVNPNMEFYLRARDVRHPADRHPADGPAGARRHRHRRAAGHLHGGRHRQRRGQRDRRAHAQHPDHAGEGPDRPAGREEQEGRCEGVCLRQRDHREGRARGAVDRARQDAADRGRAGPPRPDEGLHPAARAGGQRQGPAHRDQRCPPEGDVVLGAAARLADVAAHEPLRKAFPALADAAAEVGTPQIRNVGTVGGNLCQRPRCWYFRNEEFRCLKKGGAQCFAVEGENQFHAIFGDAPCHIVHPSSLAVPLIAYDATIVVAGPKGERKVRGRGVLPDAGSPDVRRDGARAERTGEAGDGADRECCAPGLSPSSTARRCRGPGTPRVSRNRWRSGGCRCRQWLPSPRPASGRHSGRGPARLRTGWR